QERQEIMVVIDTDIIIWILRGNKDIEELFKKVVIETEGYIFITPIQIAEIYAGIRQKERLDAENFIESLSVIDINKNIGRLAGDFINRYGRTHNVTMADAMIAASAKINVFKLWTLNKRHYPMFTEKEFFQPA
ncbi:MAG: type II toxin-antitoxin system VapC family toxin, partial [Nitrospirota bacterium]